MTSRVDLRRRLPSVELVLQEPAVQDLASGHGRVLVLRHLRNLLDEARERAAAGDEPGFERLIADLPGALARRLQEIEAPSLVATINATGVVVHTNLGRAPLGAEAAARVAALVSSYSNLELDLADGERGQREVHAETRLRRLLGVESTVVVNNNAAAVFLAVNTFAEGREVVVSRGELVEIGGSFRIPDVLRKGGARLREVGTTNRTRIADYRDALGPDTAMILKVHPSNFRILGFTESPELAELVELGRAAGVLVVDDQGSGLLDARGGPLPSEPSVRDSLVAGVDLVTFSGDKLLGGPQAGLVAGRRNAVDAMRRNPLYRALRVDKMTLAALDATLAAHESGLAAERIPVLRMLALTADEVRARAEALARGLREEAPALAVEIVTGSSAVGGGAAPTRDVATALLAIAHPDLAADRFAKRLRAGSPPVVARVAEGRVVLDLRTVLPREETALRQALVRAAS